LRNGSRPIAALLAAAVLFGSSTATTIANASPAQTAAIESALDAPTLAGAHAGVLAVDAENGTVLYARNADDDFVPASTLKLVVGSAALARLGATFTFATSVEAAGSIAGGTLDGDLYLRGGGDAQLSPADLDAAAAAVAAAGVRRVAGALVGDASRYDAPRYPPGWSIDDIPYEYAAVPSALSLGLNVAHVRVLPGDAAGAPAILRVRPQSGAFTVENAALTGAPRVTDSTDLERPWDRPQTIRVVGTYPLGAPLSDDLEPAVPDPAAYAADLFLQALAARGVTVDAGVRFGGTPAGATLVWTHRSKPLGALLRDFWPPSTNLIGEQLLEELGAQAPHRGVLPGSDVRERGIAVENDWLHSIGVDAKTLTIADGSGLSEYDRVTPRALVTILNADWHGPARDTVMAALPVAGASGTLRSTFAAPPLEGAVYAKTGTTNHARLLAGYARTQRGRTVIFALMINDWMDGSANAPTALDAARAKILRALVTR
jgi:D-alanyl-D-alanine carboxypeptidase/D-alanyl-D-alanine-endopeptidase (penicillin-binding protein 4)